MTASLNNYDRNSTRWTGHVDEDGLHYIGWNDDDINALKTAICWNEEDDELYAVPQDHKDLWDSSEKVMVSGRTMLANISVVNNMGTTIKYIPMCDTSNETEPFGNSKINYKYKSLIAMPKLDLSSVTTMYSVFSGCRNLKYLDLYLPNCTSLDYMFSGAQILMSYLKVNAPIATSAKFLFNQCNSQYIELILPKVTDAGRLIRASAGIEAHLTLGDKTSSWQKMLDSTSDSLVIYLHNTRFSENLIGGVSYMPASSGYKIPYNTGCNYNAVKSWLETMLKGLPNYMADSYTMMFNDSTVYDDADGTIQTMIDRCTEMKWAITGLSIIPHNA